MKLRKTRVEDIDEVCAILDQARERLGALGIDQWQNGYPNRAAIEEDVACGRSYVVTEGAEASDVPDAIIATAMIDASGEPTYDVIYDGSWLTSSSSACPSYVTVHRVAVADGATGRGVARFLLGEAARMARDGGAQSVRIDTHEGNAPMRGLLRSCGFTECGVILLDDPLEPTQERLAFEKLV